MSSDAMGTEDVVPGSEITQSATIQLYIISKLFNGV